MSGSIVAGVTVIWLLFEWIGYHLLTFVCHALILTLAILFLWSNFASFVNKSPPKFPEILLPEELFVRVALSLRYELNQAFITFREVASGKDLKNFLMVIAVLWVLSIVGGWFTFLTLFYLAFLMLYTLPVLYEKHEDQVDTFAEKALIEINKQYAVFDEKVLQKLPKYAMNKNKKLH
ncbi:Reticulon [Macleaya cordata]|uniref:Reticulon-like protein n=1 Tax=Macleaya cordata TaxID=56857 RepID=A0A200PN62_MACCD|nr:Reticulon [Macleaya cordata]